MSTTAPLISAHAEFPELSWAFRSHPGVVRPDNEDCVGAYAPAEPEEHARLFVVADGMGGHAAGEVASRLAVESLLQEWTTAAPSPLAQSMRRGIRRANGAVFSASLDQDQRGMGTTLTALALAGTEASIGHVGDSRAYQVRDGSCSQLTADHSRVGEMLRMRLITPEQAAHHPARSQLTRSLGFTPAVQVDLVRADVRPGDAFVLCSDGLWDVVSRADISAAVAASTADEAAEALLERSLSRGAPDNVTVIVAKVLAEQPQPPAVRARGPLAFLRR